MGSSTVWRIVRQVSTKLFVPIFWRLCVRHRQALPVTALVGSFLHCNHGSGLLAEQFVARHLEALGATVLARRWRCSAGEIDLVVRLGECLCFIEVKARSRVNLDSDGLEAINWRKRKRICQSANLFLLKNPHLNILSCRFDVALVRKNPRTGLQLLTYLSGAFVFEG